MTHDWQKLIAEISAQGVTDYKIAQMLDIQLIQLGRLKRGSEPRHSVGEVLLALHRVLVKAPEKVSHETLQT